MHGGERIVEVLERHGVRFLFTLCGGHISPILVAAKARGIRVVDTRHEATAVFAADAMARLTGVPGVAAVTAGPGVTNSITALKNAQLAQSPLVLLGGATATVLKGRGALQDIDQRALVEPHVKWYRAVRRVRDLADAVDEAFYRSREGVPGPVFVEAPVDLLYPEATVREWYGLKSGGRGGLVRRVEQAYLGWHLGRVFAPAGASTEFGEPAPTAPSPADVEAALRLLTRAQRPVVVVGSQAVLAAREAGRVAVDLTTLGAPTYLSGTARGLLGAESPVQVRHRRKEALREADVVLLCGVPADFRLDYGRQLGRATQVIAVNRHAGELRRNHRPRLALHADPALVLHELAARLPAGSEATWSTWLETLRARDREREGEIDRQAETGAPDGVHPLRLFRELDRLLEPESVLVADGGDFVATASYVVRPRGPLSWLDPGVFGTLGVGAGFALAAKLARPESEVWLLWGDGSAGYGLAELDTFVRHAVPVIALVGNDASWSQIARDQVTLLGDAVGTELARSTYERVAEGLGGKGLLLDKSVGVAGTLTTAKALARRGHPVLVNVHLARSDFRQGSISI
ncbi:MAG: thiamine pyrophosphate-binding protein [Holophagales bacterium]|nr:MAG: thiamine pyrophosphate-binding protein [Holophagales bacterium]